MPRYTKPNAPAGVVITAGPDGPPDERETLQCPHCGGHWIPVKGSGRPHVWCGPCHAWTCSEIICIQVCYPFEKRCEDMARMSAPVLGML